MIKKSFQMKRMMVKIVCLRETRIKIKKKNNNKTLVNREIYLDQENICLKLLIIIKFLKLLQK